MHYLFDENGVRIGFVVDGTDTYYYRFNLQGDVTGIYNASGTLVAQYTYDAWGNPETPTGDTNIANLNPIRYRGYYYDTETGFYYVSSRYYDPEIGRWINADGVIAAVNESIHGYNQFAYCFNNPINMEDETGHWPQWMLNVSKTITKNVAKAVKKAIDPIIKVAKNITKDLKNYNKSNENAQTVIKANYFSSYKNVPVIKLPIDNNAFSCGVIVIGNNVKGTNTIKHEYGHAVQLEKMGLVDYVFDVGIPSVTAFVLNEQGKLPYDYYGSPWEAEADKLGGVDRNYDNKAWPEEAYKSYFDLLQLFFD